ncbi:uncharacterized protein LOC107043381 [Diachasma alloeum]|uniref:uncharacterized protein LOC107043381 n=1 Tax=Diachasma alloeum TaxID=454923 RepID=UPI00073840DE|nr:uncharacterized protein LOC107043381 [Diachasma alloeum]
MCLSHELDETDCSESNEGQEISHKKKLKKGKHPKQTKQYLRKYKQGWEKDERYKAWLSSSTQGPELFFCRFCSNHYKCSKTAIERHMKSKTHEKAANEFVNQQTLSSMKSIEESRNFEMMTKENEIRIASFIAKHDLSFNLSPHLVKMIQSLNLDQKVLKNLSCAKTKCQAIICNVTGAKGKEKVIQLMRSEKFSLLIDESTDISSTKNLAVVTRILVDGVIRDLFVGLFEIAEANTNNIYSILVGFFDENAIPYKQNMVGFAADGASVMMGRNHSVSVLLKKDIPSLFVMRCTCHSLALCACAACGKLPEQVDSTMK